MVFYMDRAIRPIAARAMVGDIEACHSNFYEGR
jgi:hypothetical protein